MGQSMSWKQECDRYSKNAICVLERRNNISGVINFHQCTPNDLVKVRFTLYGPAKDINAVHIHEYGDLVEGCKSLGSHFNPHHQTHGSIHFSDLPRHVGDLINNIEFDDKGRFFFEYNDPLISLNPSDRAFIIGRSIVIHKKMDDLGQGKGDARKESLLTGNAGERIQWGLIGFSSSKHF